MSLIHTLTRKDTGTCKCPLELLELLGGQHLQQCRANRIGRRRFFIGPRRHLAPFTVAPQQRHTVDGVTMPWVWTPAPGDDTCVKPPVRVQNHNFKHCCIDHGWCDMSADGQGGFLARRWKDLRLCATAVRVDGSWRWQVIDLTAGDDEKNLVAAGVERQLRVLIRTVGYYIEDVKALRINSTSWSLHDLRDEV
jgi:hypothetical protein